VRALAVRLATLGVILLERTSRPVELSPAGKVLLAEAKGACSSAERPVTAIQEAARDV
jgi:DNA-binding transcriptional LysR family regulator